MGRQQTDNLEDQLEQCPKTTSTQAALQVLPHRDRCATNCSASGVRMRRYSCGTGARIVTPPTTSVCMLASEEYWSSERSAVCLRRASRWSCGWLQQAAAAGGGKQAAASRRRRQEWRGLGRMRKACTPHVLGRLRLHTWEFSKVQQTCVCVSGPAPSALGGKQAQSVCAGQRRPIMHPHDIGSKQTAQTRRCAQRAGWLARLLSRWLSDTSMQQERLTFCRWGVPVEARNRHC